MSGHSRRVPTYDALDHVEVAHGDHCLIVMLGGTTIPKSGAVLTSTEARRLAHILERQAAASEQDDQP